MPVSPTTDCTPTAAMTLETTTNAQMAVWGVENPLMKLRNSGTSRASAMPLLMRTAVFMQLRVVPMIAMATVSAMVIITPKPNPGIRLLPISLLKSPIGALDADAAAMAVTVAAVAPVPVVPVSLSPIILPAAKYSSK